MYVKLFAQIFDSSVAEDYHTRHIFMDLLVLAEPDGTLDMTLEAIARRTNVPLDVVTQAIERLCTPDPQSRSQDCDGARLVLLDDHRDWGWRIVNFVYYRQLKDPEEKRQQDRERQRRKRTCDKGGSQPVTHGHAPSRNVAHADAEAEVEADVQTSVPSVPTSSVAYAPLVELWNDFAEQHGRKSVSCLTDSRRKKLGTRCEEMARCGDVEAVWKKVLAEAAKNDWMLKKTAKWNGITFDWLIANDTNWLKVWEGQYGESQPKPESEEDRWE